MKPTNVLRITVLLLCLIHRVALAAEEVTPQQAQQAMERFQKALRERRVDDVAKFMGANRAAQHGGSKAGIDEYREQISDPDFWQMLVLNGFLPDAKLRNVDLVFLPKKNKGVARFFLEGSGKCAGSDRAQPCLGFVQGMLLEGQWVFVPFGGEAFYWIVVPKPNFSTPGLASRTVRNAVSMRDWQTLHASLESGTKKLAMAEDYQQVCVVVEHKSLLDFAKGNEQGTETELKEQFETLPPSGTAAQVKIEGRVFVKEGSEWKWLPESESPWHPSKVKSAVRKQLMRTGRSALSQ